jgi:putative tryptophan/tyrosine transport system substrate-binding protein
MNPNHKQPSRLRTLFNVSILTAVLIGYHVLAEAQVGKRRIHRIGYLTVSSLTAEAPRLKAFRQGLLELGYAEDHNIIIEPRSADGIYERLPVLAGELLKMNIDLILSGGSSATRVAHKATQTVPIIIASSTDDPVTSGLVASLARPGGNITGLTSISTELTGKRLELIREVLPNANRAAVLFNPDNPGHVLRLKEIDTAARAMKISLRSLPVMNSKEFEGAFRAAVNGRADVINVMADALFNSHRKQIGDLAVKNRLPAMYDRDDFVNAGGLMSYGVDIDDLYRRAAYFVEKIFKGAKPGDLPVEQPTKFELMINLKTAKQIGLIIPPHVLARADRLIR